MDDSQFRSIGWSKEEVEWNRYCDFLQFNRNFYYIGDREQCGQLVMFLILTPNMRPNNQSLSIRFLRN